MNGLVLLSATSLAGADAPEWVQLAPAGSFSGADGRGPYALPDAAGVMAASLRSGKGRLPIDENHAIDLAAPKGRPSPARGWVVALEQRADGVWGRVEWTDEGRALVASRAYRGISPVLMVDKDRNVLSIARASLTNDPNLTQLATLHSRSPDMDFMHRMREALGLAASASEDDVVAAATSGRAAVETHAASIAAIVQAVGLAEGSDAKAVMTALQARAAEKTTAEADLRKTVVELQTRLETVTAAQARRDAEAFVDGAIKDGKVGLKPLREHYVERHMKDPVGVEKEVAAMVSIHAGGLARREPAAGGAALTEDEERTCALMGIDPKAFAESRKELTETL